MRDFELAMKAMGDPTRTRILKLLEGGGLCVCQVQAVLGLAPSTVSKHLFLLKQAGLLESRMEGRWIYYSLPGRQAPVAVCRALEWACGCLKENPQIAADAARLKQVLKCDPSELCKRQCQK